MSKKKRKTITTISKISGAVIGASLGTVIAGPLGTITGGAIGEVTSILLSDTFTDVLKRQLSKKEETRIKTVFIYAKEKIEKNLSEGKSLRRDVKPEMLEETLLISKVTTDERKLIFLGNLYANTLFETNLDNDDIYHLLRVAKNLQFREMCIIALFGQRDKYSFKSSNYREYEKIPLKREFLLTLEQIKHLEDKYLVDCEGIAVIGLTDLNPSKIKLSSTGSLLYRLMELNKIDKPNLIPIHKVLNYSKSEAQIS